MIKEFFFGLSNITMEVCAKNFKIFDYANSKIIALKSYGRKKKFEQQTILE